MKKYKIKSSVKISLLIIILLIIIFSITNINTSKSYSLEYNINNYDINENYDKQKKLYYYEIKHNDVKYNFIFKSNYIKEKKLINEINEYTEEEYTCLTIKSDYVESIPLCSKDNKLIDYHLINKELKEELKEYYKEEETIEEKIDNYKIYNKQDMLIWNYKGFNYIKDNKIEKINIFKKDIYEIPLATQINEYIIIPDYEQDYNFNRIYILNLLTLEKEVWEIKYDISFQSYINGINDKSIFLTDTKNEIQYELVPHKKKMRIVGKKRKDGVIYVKGVEERVSISDLVEKNKYFTSTNPYVYTLKDNKLYLSYNDSNITTLITEDIDKIAYINNDTIFYYRKNTLYKFNLKYGENKVIEYEEWNYNNTNPIFINN